MKNGRCRMHGGLSTGPRTAKGLARSRRARWKHGFCSAEIRRLRSDAAHTARNLADLVRLARDLCRPRTQSSLGMGFIERISTSASVPLDGSLQGSPQSHEGHEVSGANIAIAARPAANESKKEARTGPRNHHLCDLRDFVVKPCFSLGTGFIERNRYSAPSSRGALDGGGGGRAPNGPPAPVRGSG
jgi:hypothetical protein